MKIIEKVFYRGNELVKDDNAPHSYTPEEVIEYNRCMHDPVYFAKKYVKVISLDRGLVPFELYPYQEKMFKHFRENRFSIVLACRQSGKCVEKDTEVAIRFLDSKPQKVSVSIVFNLFSRIKKIYDLYISGKYSKEQVLLDLFSSDSEESRVFIRMWREASHNSKEYWWRRFSTKPCYSNPSGTFSRSSSVKENVPEGFSGISFHGQSSTYDEHDAGRDFPATESSICSMQRGLHSGTLRNTKGIEQSFLREDLCNPSTGNERETSFRILEEKNSRIFEGKLEGSNFPRENVGGSKGEDSFSRSSRKCKHSTTQALQKTRIKKQGEEYQSRNEIKDISSYSGYEKICRNQGKNVSFIQGKKKIGRSSKKNKCHKAGETNGKMSSLRGDWEGRWSNDPIPFCKLPRTEKFTESYEDRTFGFRILTETGWEELYQAHKTIPFKVWELKTSLGLSLKCADNHIVFKDDGSEVFTKNLKLGDSIQTVHGIETVVSIEPLGYEEEMYDLGVNTEKHSYYTNGILSHNSISVVAYILWYAIFHSDQTIAILANKGATAREMLSRITLALENLPFFLQPGCKALNKGSITFSNNSRIMAAATSSSSIRGWSINLLFIDEFAFVHRATEFYTSTYPVISSGTNTKVIITSTANGVGNQFYRIWAGAVQGSNEFKPFRVDWWDVPGRDEAWKKRTIANTSELQFAQEFSNSFLGTSNTLLESSKLLELKASPPVYTRGSFKVYQKPIEGHKYIMTVDVSRGRGQDYSTFTIIDVSERPFQQVAIFRDNRISPLLFPDAIVSAAKHYNNALLLIENNDAGQVVCNAVYYEYEYENTFVESAMKAGGVGVTMTKRVKRIGCSNLKDLIEMNKLVVHDSDTISELSTFEAHGGSYAASESNHDDLAMNLVMFAWFVSTEAFGEDVANFNLKDLLLEGMDDKAMDELSPFGFIDNGVNQPTSSNRYQEMAEELRRWKEL